MLDLLQPGLGPVPGTRFTVSDRWLEILAERYLTSTNPVYVWEAVALAIDGDRPLPSWVLRYLGRVSMTFHAMSRTMIPEKELAPAVYQALEFPKRHGTNPFRLQGDLAHDVAIAMAVWRAVGDGSKPDYAVNEVARAHPARCYRRPRCTSISRSTVLRLWNQYKSQLPAPVRRTRTPDP